MIWQKFKYFMKTITPTNHLWKPISRKKIVSINSYWFPLKGDVLPLHGIFWGRAFRTQIGQSTFFVLTILCLCGYGKPGRA